MNNAGWVRTDGGLATRHTSHLRSFLLDSDVGFSFLEREMENEDKDSDADGCIGHIEGRPVVAFDREVQKIDHLPQTHAIQ